MTQKCMVPEALEMREGKLEYKCCGLEAKYKVGDWFICEGHKKHYSDKQGWKAISINSGDVNYD